MRTIVLASLLALGACSTIDQHTLPPADWPEVRIVENRVSYGEVLKRCYKYLTLGEKLIGGIPLACAEVFFAEAVCHIWITPNIDAEIIKHERLHCLGYDHPGADNMRGAWQRYKEGR